jgi:hypothetical protein
MNDRMVRGHQRQIGSDDILLIRAPNKSHSITGGVGNVLRVPRISLLPTLGLRVKQ